VGGYHCVAIKKSNMEDGQNHTYKTTALCHLLSLCMCCCIARCSNDIFGQPESRREMTYYRICLYILIYSGSVLCSATGYDYCIPTWKTSKLDSDYAFFRLLQAAVVFLCYTWPSLLQGQMRVNRDSLVLLSQLFEFLVISVGIILVVSTITKRLAGKTLQGDI